MKIMTAKIMRSKDVVVSEPPTGYKKITNTYVDPNNGKLVIIHDE